jgi:hypothetical protein
MKLKIVEGKFVWVDDFTSEDREVSSRFNTSEEAIKWQTDIILSINL